MFAGRWWSFLERLGGVVIGAAALVAGVDAAFRSGQTHPTDVPLLVAIALGTLGLLLAVSGLVGQLLAKHAEPADAMGPATRSTDSSLGGAPETPVGPASLSFPIATTDSRSADVESPLVTPSLRTVLDFPEILLRSPTGWLLSVQAPLCQPRVRQIELLIP